MTNKNLYDILKERGLLYQCTDEDALKEKLQSGTPLTVYEGTDPTADSLHIGHCVPYCILRRFQQAGHKVVLLLGGATGSVGDPSGKTELRSMLSHDKIANNIDSIKNTLSVFLDFDGDNPAEIVNNADWFNQINFVDFMRDIGVHFNVNKMLSSDIYANRLQEGGLTFFEMSYMLMQGYDFVHLNRTHGCTLQYGGADQWTNILAGVELQRKLNFQNGTDVGLIGATNPLLLTPDGKKMGKTEKGAIWIDSNKISAYDFYQGVYQTPDACVKMMFALFTDVDMKQVDEMIATDIVNAKHVLSFEVTKFVRNEQDAITAQTAAKSLFSGAGNLDNAPTYEIENSNLPISLVDLITTCKLVTSKSEGRRMCEQGAVQIDGVVQKDFAFSITADLFTNNELLLKKGKKNFMKIVLK